MAVRGTGYRLIVLVALVAMIGLWVVVARTLANPPAAVVSSSHSSAVVWAGRVFTDSVPLRRWLHTRGVAYSVWAARHPLAGTTLR